MVVQRLILAVFLGSCLQALPSEDPLPKNADDLFVAKRWQTEDGLPQNSVLAIAQTPDGYLWLGTFNGLVRFDGVRFTAYAVGNTPELRSDSILILAVTPDGTSNSHYDLGRLNPGRVRLPPNPVVALQSEENRDI